MYVLRIARNSKHPDIDIAAVLNNIDVNEIENLHLMGDSKDTNTTTINSEDKTVETNTQLTTESVTTEETKNCLKFDEERYELVNLCPNSTDAPRTMISTKPIFKLNATQVSSNFSGV